MTSRIFFSFTRGNEQYIPPIINFLERWQHHTQTKDDDISPTDINKDNFDVFIACIANQRSLEQQDTELSQAISAKLPIIIIFTGNTVVGLEDTVTQKLQDAQLPHNPCFIQLEKPDEHDDRVKVASEIQSQLVGWRIIPPPEQEEEDTESNGKFTLIAVGVVIVIVGIIALLALSGGDSPDPTPTPEGEFGSQGVDITTAPTATPLPPSPTATDEPEPTATTPPPTATDEPEPTATTPPPPVAINASGEILYIAGGIIHKLGVSDQSVTPLEENPSVFNAAVWGPPDVILSTEDNVLYNLDSLLGVPMSSGRDLSAGQITDIVFARDIGYFITVSTDGDLNKITRFSTEADLYGQQLYSSPSTVTSISWSGDREHIVFALHDGVQSRLYTLNANVNNSDELLIDTSTNDTSPVWSPVEDVVWFLRKRDGINRIVQLDVTTKNVSALILPSMDYEPMELTISPDGEYLGFIGTDANGRQDLFVIHTSNGEFHQLTEDGQSKSNPEWG